MMIEFQLINRRRRSGVGCGRDCRDPGTLTVNAATPPPSVNALNFGYNKSELEMSVLNSCWLGVPDEQLSFNRAR